MNAFRILRMWQTSKKNVVVNCFPLSEIKSVVGPNLNTQSVTNAQATELVEMFFNGTVFTSLVNRSTMNRRYQFPHGVRTNSPRISMHIDSRGALAGNSVNSPIFWPNLILFRAHLGPLRTVS